MITGSLASSTLQQYLSSFERVAQFCATRGLATLPMAPSSVLAFLAHLGREDQVHGSTLRKYTGAIRKVHEWAGVACPLDNAVVKAAVVGFQRSTKGRAVKLDRVPLLLGHAQAVVTTGLQAVKQGAWSVVEYCAVVIWQFVFFWRASSLVQQRLEGVELGDKVIDVLVSFEKVGSLAGRRVSFVRLAPAGMESVPHPFDLLAAWIRRRLRSGDKLLLTSPSYEYVVECWSNAVALTGIVAPLRGRYLPHSGRSGGASAASAAGAPDTVLMVRGGWQSAATLRSYVVETRRHMYDVLYFGFLTPAAPTCS